MNTEDAIQVAITKATAAEGEAAYYTKCLQATEFAEDEALGRVAASRQESAEAEVTLQQNLKIALTALL